MQAKNFNFGWHSRFKPPYPVHLRAQLISLCIIVAIISLLILAISTGVYFTNNYKSLRAEQLYIAAQLKSSQLDQSLKFLYYQSIWFRDSDLLAESLVSYTAGNKTKENWVESIDSISAFLTSSSVFSRITLYDSGFNELYNVSNNDTGDRIANDVLEALTPLSRDVRLPSIINTVGFVSDPVLNDTDYLLSISLPILANPSIILSDSRVYGYITIIASAKTITSVFNDTTALENSNVAIISAVYRNSTLSPDGYHFVLPPYGSPNEVIDYFYPLSNNSFLSNAFLKNSYGSVDKTTFFYSSPVAVGYYPCDFDLSNWVAVVSQPESVFLASTTKLTKIIAGTVVAIAVFVAILTFFMSYYVVKPIINLKQATELISQGRGLRSNEDGISDLSSRNDSSLRINLEKPDQNEPISEEKNNNNDESTTKKHKHHNSLTSTLSNNIMDNFNNVVVRISRSDIQSATSSGIITGDDIRVARVPVRSTIIKDELTELKETFNVMADALDGHSNLLEARVKARTKELEAAKIIAESTNEAKTVFIANISHELRTPLNGILGMTAIALEEDDTEKLQSSLKLIYRSGELLLHILTELLTFSKNVLQKTKLEKVDFSISDIALQIKSLFGKIARDQGVRLSILISPNIIRSMVFFGDSNRIIQVVMNLVSNALKFTPIDGKVSVKIRLLGEYDEKKSKLNNYKAVYIKEGTETLEESAINIHLKTDLKNVTDSRELEATEKRSRSSTNSSDSELAISSSSSSSNESSLKHLYENKHYPGQEAIGLPITDPKQWVVSVEVEDTGPGISETLQKSVFEPFVQGDQTLSRQYGGTGLGLSICRQLASIMHGTMDLDSKEGLGSKFTFTLPLLQRRKLDLNEQEASFEDEFNIKSKKNRSVSFKINRAHKDSELSKSPEIMTKSKEDIITEIQENKVETGTTKLGTKDDETSDNEPPSFKVLVVEDNRVNQEVIKRLLKLEKINSIDYAVDGQEAIDIVKERISKEEYYDLIFMDIQMPNVDGLTATRIIRNDLKYVYPIVALTAFADDSNKKECFNSGMNGFLAKPIKRLELSKTLQDFKAWTSQTQEVI